MAVAAEAAPLHNSIATTTTLPSADAQGIIASSKIARSSRTTSNRDTPVGSSFYTEKPPIDLTNMDEWNEDQTKQFDAAQALFPCTEHHCASGSSYSVYDFIKAAVHYLSLEYAEKERTSISEAIGAHFEHFRVDLAGPAPCKWEEARTSFALKEAVAYFVKVYAKAVHAKMRSSYESAMAFIDPYVGISTSRPATVSPLSSAFSYTPTRDTFRFSSPMVATPSTPPTPLSATPSIDFGSTARPLQFETPPSAPKAPRLGRSPRRNGVQGLILFQDIPDFPNAQSELEERERAASELLYERIETKMQEVRNLELQLQQLESQCARYDARIYNLDKSSVCKTSITSTGALFNLDFLAMNPPEQVEFLDAQIEKLQLAIDSTELLNDLKATQLAILEQSATATKQYRSARKEAWDVLQLRAKKLRAQFRYDQVSNNMTASNKQATLVGKEAIVPSSDITGKARPRPRTIDDETANSIFRSICMEVPTKRSSGASSSSSVWSHTEDQRGSLEVTPEMVQPSSVEVQNTENEGEGNVGHFTEMDYNARKRHDSPYNEPEPFSPKQLKAKNRVSGQEEPPASSWSIWPTPGANTPQADENKEDMGHIEDSFHRESIETVVHVADPESSHQAKTLSELWSEVNPPSTPSFTNRSGLDPIREAPEVPDLADIRPLLGNFGHSRDSSDSNQSTGSIKTVRSLFEDYEEPSKREAQLSPSASEVAHNRLSKVSKLAKMFETSKE